MLKQIYIFTFVLHLLFALPSLGMENNTYPCDNCHQKKSLLNRYILSDDTVECLHIMCQDCSDTIYSAENNNYVFGCPSCYYFYTQKNKQYWQEIEGYEGSSIAMINLDIDAQTLKTDHPNRLLPDTLRPTVLPQPHQNPDQVKEIPTSHNHTNSKLPKAAHTSKKLDNTAHPPEKKPIPPTNVIVPSNKLKWLGLSCVASVICYSAYKAYAWWKNEEPQEKDETTPTEHE